MTLRFFGELAPLEIESAVTALRTAAGSLTNQMTAQGGPVTRFLGPGLIVWPVDGLQHAAEAVENSTAGIGEPVPERRFYGHMTMARGRRGTDLRRARHLLAPLAISWPVTALSLVQSQLHPDGARYSDVERFNIGTSTST